MSEATAEGREGLITCPYCGHENIAGEDRCENCVAPLRAIDIPEAHQERGESAFSAPLSELRSARPPFIVAAATVREAIAALREDPNGALIVVDESGESIVGIFTERDVLRKVAAREGALDRPLAEVLTVDPVLLRETDTVAVALHKMAQGGFRHVPVLRDGQVIGIVTGNSAVRWVMDRFLE